MLVTETHYSACSMGPNTPQRPNKKPPLLPTPCTVTPSAWDILLILSLYVFPRVLGLKSEEHSSPKPKMLTAWKLWTASRIRGRRRRSQASQLGVDGAESKPQQRVFNALRWLRTSLFHTATFWLTPLRRCLPVHINCQGVILITSTCHPLQLRDLSYLKKQNRNWKHKMSY